MNVSYVDTATGGLALSVAWNFQLVDAIIRLCEGGCDSSVFGGRH